ncbi:2,3-bisphosphoglycerate-independent phosphoglycerate mutase [Candidatus Uhrbacteria bacterium]|jgi:2,3-bisphosphoglycerate-independent phosphoglycerate mutase|nr:2,3-bisphosphoglycerate-independent phosphoglycerate mutase [Candidatus Uhrbacteria bacterium]MBT7717697.1 2,3-bisphosphoglycerate-independent phosphoglycerate mutase [Candidatus Uhrbacteria bacterium]
MPEKKKRPRPAVLVVLDGFGIAPDAPGNAITKAKTPTLDMLTQRYPTMLLRAAGETVGLPWGEMGNSEVGHLTIGAGRIHYQDLPKIDRSIEDGDFFENEKFIEATEHVKKTGGTLHLMGVLSAGKVHGYNRHCYALMELAKKQGVKDVAIHVFLDGRDSLYNSGIEFIEALESKIEELRIGRIATISGRYYAMDRDNRWDRTQKTYSAMVDGTSVQTFEQPIEAIKASYAKEVYDEEFVPIVITKRDEPVAKVKEGDSIIFYNYRSGRARQLTKAFVLPAFHKFEREYIDDLHFTAMTEYERGLPISVAYPQEKLERTLCEIIAEKKLVQLRIAETEKYAHVTYFFNGKREKPFAQEDHIIIPSPHVSRYDQQPEMSAYKLTDRLVKEVKTGNYDVIIVNYANPDMIAHTGNLEATIKAVEVVDDCLGRVVKEVLKQDGMMMVTADHGNAEEVKNLQTGGIDKEHSTNPVPLWVVANRLEGKSGVTGDIPSKDLSRVPPMGMLSDIAPTFLTMLGIDPPEEMTGSVLVD